MPNVTIQPQLTRPIPIRENLLYCIIPTEYVLTQAFQAEAYLEFDGTAYAAGQTFIFANQVFTTTSGANTHKSFQITADPEESAGNFEASLNQNANFFGVVEIEKTEVSPGVWRVTVTWIEPGSIEPWEFDYADMVPEPPHGETAGTDIEVREGMTLRYQLWAERDGENFPVTNIEAIRPRVFRGGLATPRICINFRDDVLGLVRTSFRPNLADMQQDEAFSINIFLKYGVHQVNACEVTEFPWLSTSPVTLLNSVVQIDDEDKLTPYNYADGYPTKLLTSRPESLKVPRDARVWLWGYLTHADDANLSSYRAGWKFYDADGVFISGVNSASTFTENGVYCIPAGPGNTPAIPAGTYKIEAFFESFYGAPFDTWVQITDPHTIRITDGLCRELEFYFIEDLGGYGTIHFDHYEEITHAVENQVFFLPEIATENLYSRDLSTRLQKGGFSRANIKSRKFYRATVQGLDTPETERWFRQFCDSEDVLHRYTADTGNEVIRKIILEPSETVIRREGEYLTLEVVFRYHTDLR